MVGKSVTWVFEKVWARYGCLTIVFNNFMKKRSIFFFFENTSPTLCTLVNEKPFLYLIFL
ncbi:hypothetical protein HanIR_Chr04g0159241 [Helianthus annuus]|nr:hypothetical protein HanIR_Chr04g0159241 [Helianthus annuus]